jgi:hypothetical protein
VIASMLGGILGQLATPAQIDGSYLTTLIDLGTDVDGLTPASAGLLAKGLPDVRPCTPSGTPPSDPAGGSRGGGGGTLGTWVGSWWARCCSRPTGSASTDGFDCHQHSG